MDRTIYMAIRAIRPKRRVRDRWIQYGEVTRALFPLVPQEDMDAVCRAVARRLRL